MHATRWQPAASVWEPLTGVLRSPLPALRHCRCEILVSVSSIGRPMKWETIVVAPRREPSNALGVIGEYARHSGARSIDQDESSVSARFGSRLADRILGIAAGIDRFPVRWTATAESAGDGCQVGVRFESEAGWLLFHIGRAASAYLERFESLAAQIEAALNDA